MLYWTCPECGRECSPAVRDCPVCPPVSARKSDSADANLQATQANGGILALAQNLETIHALPILTAVPEHAVQALENGRSNHAPAGTLVEEAPAEQARELSAKIVVEDTATPAQEAILVLAEETLAIPVQQTVDSLVRPLVESVELDARTEPPAETEAPAEAAEYAVIDEREAPEIALAATPVPEAELVRETAAVAEPEVAVLPAELLSEPAAAPESVAENQQLPRTEQFSEALGDATPESQETAVVATPVPETAALAEPRVAILPAELLSEPTAAPESVAESEQLLRAEQFSEAVGDATPQAQETAVVATPVPETAAAAEPEVAILPAELLSEAAAAPESVAESEQLPRAEQFSEAIGDATPQAQETAVVATPAPEAELVRETAAVAESEVAILPTERLSESVATPEPAAESEQPSNAEEFSEAIAAAEVDSLGSPLIESVESETQSGESAKPDAPVAGEPQVPETALVAARVRERESVPEPEPVPEPAAATKPEAAILPAPLPAPQASQVELPSEPAAESTVTLQLAEVSESVATGEPYPALTSEPVPELEPFLLSEPAVIEPSENTAVSVAEPEVAAASDAQLKLEWEQSSKAENEGAESPAVSAAEESAADPHATAASPEVCCALELEAEALVEAISAGLEADRAAVGVVVASFRQQSSTALLAAPTEIVTAPAPPIFEWLRSPRPRLESLVPPPANLTAMSARPQPPTLAGPCLPRELRNPGDSEISKRSRKPSRLPAWVTSSIAATLLLLVAWSLMQYFGSQNDARASTPSGSQGASPGGAAAAQSEVLAKSLEISGLRLVTGWNGKQQVRFLIVNHSPQDLSGITAQVTVKAEGSPILLIQAPIRSLGSNQSKEIRTDLDSDVPASALSDWQSLRAEVHLTTKE